MCSLPFFSRSFSLPIKRSLLCEGGGRSKAHSCDGEKRVLPCYRVVGLDRVGKGRVRDMCGREGEKNLVPASKLLLHLLDQDRFRNLKDASPLASPPLLHDLLLLLLSSQTDETLQILHETCPGPLGSLLCLLQLLPRDPPRDRQVLQFGRGEEGGEGGGVRRRLGARRRRRGGFGFLTIHPGGSLASFPGGGIRFPLLFHFRILILNVGEGCKGRFGSSRS
ncbi:hypothetical protein IE53DRAFT_232486 [Violaceomyces palustris]|uniref:Uncharacterized protein n=1 Tax=Violaceomyces palustris TaxID=1673888 RepID=A0ACD0P4G1_9BASI|nr:hypothetical protein IE53DRAFT_232486 [Violaceomyces palustris]